VNDVEERSIPTWRIWVLRRLDAALIAFELVLTVVFLSASYLTGSLYLKGVGIGLLIAGVTSAIAHLYKRSVGART
jgi:hypothetical protein